MNSSKLAKMDDKYLAHINVNLEADVKGDDNIYHSPVKQIEDDHFMANIQIYGTALDANELVLTVDDDEYDTQLQPLNLNEDVGFGHLKLLHDPKDSRKIIAKIKLDQLTSEWDYMFDIVESWKENKAYLPILEAKLTKAINEVLEDFYKYSKSHMTYQDELSDEKEPLSISELDL